MLKWWFRSGLRAWRTPGASSWRCYEMVFRRAELQLTGWTVSTAPVRELSVFALLDTPPLFHNHRECCCSIVYFLRVANSPPPLVRRRRATNHTPSTKQKPELREENELHMNEPQQLREENRRRRIRKETSAVAIKETSTVAIDDINSHTSKRVLRPSFQNLQD